MAELKSPRRYYLAMRRRAAALEENSELVWRAKQEAEPGTALPADFPHRSQLEAAGYTTDVDIDGADAAELISAGFSSREAGAVLNAFNSLP